MTTTAPDSGLSPLLLDYATVSALLGDVHENTVRNLVRRGQLDAVRVGRRVMFRRADVEAFVDRLPARRPGRGRTTTAN